MSAPINLPTVHDVNDEDHERAILDVANDAAVVPHPVAPQPGEGPHQSLSPAPRVL